MKKRNKRYVPKPICVNVAAVIMSRNARLDDDQTTDLELAYRTAFETLLRRPDHQSWATVASTVNVGLVLCNMDFGREYEEIMTAAADGLRRTQTRAEVTDSWALDGAAIASVKQALDLHSQQIAICTAKEAMRALTKAREIVNESLDRQQQTI